MSTELVFLALILGLLIALVFRREPKRSIEQDRIDFLRDCVVNFAGSGSTLADLTDKTGVNNFGRGEGALSLVQDWSALFDAIEATRGGK